MVDPLAKRDYQVEVGEVATGYVLMEFMPYEPFDTSHDRASHGPPRARVVTPDLVAQVKTGRLFPILSPTLGKQPGYLDYAPYISTEQLEALQLRNGDQVTFRRLENAPLYPDTAKDVLFPTCEILSVWGQPGPINRPLYNDMTNEPPPAGSYLPLSKAAKIVIDNPQPGYPPAEFENFRKRSLTTFRMLDILAPVSDCQRALVTGHSQSGKTEELLMSFFLGCKYFTYHPRPGKEAPMIVIDLIGERPEEVTVYRRIANGNKNVLFFVTTFEDQFFGEVNTSELCKDVIKRLIELGRDVWFFVDSSSRMAEAYARVTTADDGPAIPGGQTVKGVFNPKLYLGLAGYRPYTDSHCLVFGSSLGDETHFDEAGWRPLKQAANSQHTYSPDMARPSFDMTYNACSTRNAGQFVTTGHSDWMIFMNDKDHGWLRRPVRDEDNNGKGPRAPKDKEVHERAFSFTAGAEQHAYDLWKHLFVGMYFYHLRRRELWQAQAAYNEQFEWLSVEADYLIVQKTKVAELLKEINDITTRDIREVIADPILFEKCKQLGYIKENTKKKMGSPDPDWIWDSNNLATIRANIKKQLLGEEKPTPKESNANAPQSAVPEKEINPFGWEALKDYTSVLEKAQEAFKKAQVNFERAIREWKDSRIWRELWGITVTEIMTHNTPLLTIHHPQGPDLQNPPREDTQIPEIAHKAMLQHQQPFEEDYIAAAAAYQKTHPRIVAESAAEISIEIAL